MSDFLNKQNFLSKFDSMIETFPALKSKAKIERIYSFVKEIPESGLSDIFNLIIDTFRHTPTPQDFNEAAIAWVKKNKTYSWKPEEGQPILCRLCGDLGIVRIQHHNDIKFDCLMNCNCKNSITKTAKLPEWDSGLSAAYKVSRCPLEWFKPVQETSFDKNNSEIKMIIQKWNEKKSVAEKYWKDMGFV